MNCIVFCGKGNNGGDGFVVARKLAEQGAAVTIVLTEGEPKTDDAARMLHLARSMELPVFSFEEQPEAVNEALRAGGCDCRCHLRQRIPRRDGCAPPPDHRKINSAIAAVFSLDVPSGINCDTGEAAQDAVNADFTIAFDSYKTAHLLPKYLPQLGQVTLGSIGIDPLAYEKIPFDHFVADEEYVYSRIPQRQPDAHNTSTGKLLNISGGIGCTGAAVFILHCRPAQRCRICGHRRSTGDLSHRSHAPGSLSFLLLSKRLPTLPAPSTAFLRLPSAAAWGTGQRQRGILEEVLYLAKCPVIIDADGINNLAMDISIVSDAKMSCHPDPTLWRNGKNLPHQRSRDSKRLRSLCAQELAAQLKSIILLRERTPSSPPGRTDLHQPDRQPGTC